tara:strand:- start:900 stop:2060 length:1161 start_codon:yes stop_codon:yes gene_type:complete
MNARITLNNYDGALTPGGGGTYSAVQWFACGIGIYGTVNYATTITEQTEFVGYCTDFDLLDDGINSTVTLTCIDALRVAGQQAQQTFPPTAGTLYSILTTVFVYSPGVWQWPTQLTGGTGIGGGVDYSGVTLPTVNTNVAFIGSPVDYINTVLLPSGPAKLWAYDLQLKSAVGAGPITDVAAVLAGLSRGTNKQPFTFSWTGVTGAVLPFKELKQSYGMDEIVSQATLTPAIAGGVAQKANGTLASLYGTRGRSWSAVAATSNASALDVATGIVNRWGSNVPFVPATLTTTTNLLESATETQTLANKKLAGDQLQNLLSARVVPAQQVTTTFKGHGTTAQTKSSIVIGRRIAATVNDTVITLELDDWTNGHSWILGTDTLNVDRLA